WDPSRHVRCGDQADSFSWMGDKRLAYTEQLVCLREHADGLQAVSCDQIQLRKPLSIELRLSGGVDDGLQEDGNRRTNRRHDACGAFDVGVEGRLVDEDLDIQLAGARQVEKLLVFVPKRGLA